MALVLEQRAFQKGAVVYPEYPILRCPSCGAEADAVDEAQYSSVAPRTYHFDRSALGELSEFDCDYIDILFIPGLWRPWGDKTFLTPVFFSPDLLIKYANHRDYRLDLASHSYGSIRYLDQWYIAFGINQRREVMMWLGDLRGLPDKERLYLRSENIPSSHDIGSEWYQSQIEAVFTNHSQESRALAARFSFNATLADLGFSISHLDAEAITRAAELKRPVVWTEDGIRNAVSAMHHVFVETLDKAGIEDALTKLGVGTNRIAAIRAHGSLKHLETVLEAVLPGEGAEVAAPFYVLDDLRMVTSHLLPQDKKAALWASLFGRANVPDGDLAGLYEWVTNGLAHAYEALDAKQTQFVQHG